MILERPLGRLIDLGRERGVSGDELKRLVEARGEALRRLGVSRGDRVLLVKPNGIGFFADLFALWELGACAVPADPGMPAAELANVAEHALAGALLREAGDESLRRSRRRSWSAPSPADAALILYTSGTTGNPKGAVHSFRSLGARLRALAQVVPRREVRRTLCVLPASFGHGLIGNCLFPLLSGGDICLAPRAGASALALGEAVDRSAATFLSSVPALWRMTLRFGAPPRRKTLLRVHCASAPMTAALWKDVRAWTRAPKVLNVYGATETASWIAGSDGRALPCDGYVGRGWGARFKLGSRGEVWVRTASLMEGYFRAEASTREAVADGWYRTGDLGRLAPDGGLVLLGRADDAINRAGATIQPEDIDRVLLEHPRVSDACAFGAADEISGEAVCAAVVLRPGGAGGAQAARSALEAWCRERLSAPKVPSRWYFLKALPRNPRGKLDRRRVAAACAGQR